MEKNEVRSLDRSAERLNRERLPILPGVAFVAACRPASDEAKIGGDWYDAFNLPDRRVAISVGDVAGHGLEAAIIMGEVRQAIRKAAVGAYGPAAVLDCVNRIVALRESIGMGDRNLRFLRSRIERTFVCGRRSSAAALIARERLRPPPRRRRSPTGMRGRARGD
ncbi:MAG TPA: SpoIIE family protein phosphatase [Candidatus Binatia bacterium]|nr:SpoIIE family protein phosphatase [Candidatus Binatia bacterium]